MRTALNIAGNLLYLGLLLSACEVFGETTLRAAVERAAQTNPGVQATWEAFEASTAGLRAAKGRYLPQVDFLAEKGRERTEDPLEIEQSYDIQSYRFTLTQMLFDGFATRHEVAKQNYIMLTRYYEFKLAAEQMGLETAQAFLDVLRYRTLLELAKENYFQHERYHRDIESRVSSGLDRGVDLAQAKARLALAESNVLTEATNLHDVSARYHRLVGVFPADEMRLPEVSENAIPTLRKDALDIAFIFNPELNATIENIRSTRADYKGKNAPMMPRLDLRLRKQIDENTRGTLGEYDEEAIELVLSYNLYNGGSDRARRKQAKYLMYEATNTRDRVCREVRQTVSIAHNDIDSKARLITFLKRNHDAIFRARGAYRNQFDIGQRTLLDLLDTENEYFEVKRTLTNAQYDLILSKLQTMAGMGKLLSSMEISGLNTDKEQRLDLSREDALNARCPSEAPAMTDLNFDVSHILQESAGRLPLAKRSVMRLDVKFENGSSNLGPGNAGEIERVANFLCESNTIKGVVEGHTDSMGPVVNNQALSQARAETVRDALLAECSQALGRLSARGYGEARPIASNANELGRATNRRVELVLESD